MKNLNNKNITDKLNLDTDNNISSQNEEINTEKYVKLAKERIANTYKTAIKENDIVKLKHVKQQIDDLNKITSEQGFGNYMSFVIENSINVLSNKHNFYNSKNLHNLKKSKKDLENALETTTESYKQMHNLMNSLDKRLNDKNEMLLNYHKKLQELEKNIANENKDLNGLEKTMNLEKDNLTKQALSTLLEESKMKLNSLKSDLAYEQQTYTSSLNDRNMYLVEKVDLQASKQIFKFNILFYRSELNELDFLIEKHKSPSFMQTDLVAQINYSNVAKTKVDVKEIENSQIKLYNEVMESQSSLSEMKKSYTELHKNSPKIKS